MSEWRECTLGEIAQINPTEKLSKGTKAKKVPMEALQPFTKKIPWYEDETYKGGVKFKNEDTLIARITPSLENGKTTYVDILEDDEIGFGSTEFIVLREIENISDKQFLYYLACSPEFRDIAIQPMTGSSGRQRVQNDVLISHDFLLPPLKEQKAIAEVLSSLDDKIDLLHRQNKTLENLAQTLFRQWFIEEAKDEWEEVTVGDIAILKSGKSRPKNNDELNLIPIYGDNGILDYTSQYNAENKSIIIGRVGAYCGSLYLENKPIWVSDNALLAKPKNDIFSKFLFYILKNNELNFMAEGSSHPFLTQGLIKSIPIPLPPEKRLIKFNQQINTWYEKINFNKEQIKTLENMKDTLLPKLMSGKIGVKI